MKRTSAIMLVLLLMINVIIGVGFADEKKNLTVLSTYNVFYIDHDNLVIKVIKSEEGFSVFFDDVERIDYLDGNGEVLVSHIRFMLPKKAIGTEKMIVTTNDNRRVEYKVIYIEPFAFEINSEPSFYQYSDNLVETTHLDPEITFNELLANFTLNQGVKVMYLDDDGNEVNDLGNQLVLNYPDALRLVRDGDYLKPVFNFRFTFAYNGKQSVYDSMLKVRGKAGEFLPLDKPISYEDLVKQLKKENPIIKSVIKDNFYELNDSHDIIYPDRFQSIFVSTSNRVLSHITFTKLDAYDYQDANEKVLQSYKFPFDMASALVVNDQDMFSEICLNNRAYYGIKEGTTIQEFVDAFDVVNDALTFRFTDNETGQEIYDYHRPLKSHIVMKSEITDGVKSETIYPFFDLPYEQPKSDLVEYDGAKLILLENMTPSQLGDYTTMSNYEWKNSMAYIYGNSDGVASSKVGRLVLRKDGMIRPFSYDPNVEYYYDYKNTSMNDELKDRSDEEKSFTVRTVSGDHYNESSVLKSSFAQIDAIKRASLSWKKSLETDGSNAMVSRVMPIIIEPIANAVVTHASDEVLMEARNAYLASVKEVLKNDTKPTNVLSHINTLTVLAKRDLSQKRVDVLVNLKHDLLALWLKEYSMMNGEPELKTILGATSKLSHLGDALENAINVRPKDYPAIAVNFNVDEDLVLSKDALALIGKLDVRLNMENQSFLVENDEIRKYRQEGLVFKVLDGKIEVRSQATNDLVDFAMTEE